MIDRLENCPNCGAVLDDTGRCNFCGSKVYDLFDIDVSGNHEVKYLRVKTSEGLMIAPIVCNTVNMEMSRGYIPSYDGLYRNSKLFPDITIGMEFRVVGDVIYERSEKE